MCKEFVSLRQLLGPLFFVLYINHLSRIISDNYNPVLFASDTIIIIIISIIIITHSNPLAYRHNINEVFREINEWFQDNLLLLIYDKTYFFQFVTKKN